MKYFFINLSAHFAIALILMILVLCFISRNNQRKTKHGISYLLPLALAAFFLFDMVRYVGPRVMDIPDVLNDNFQTTVGVLQEVSYFENSVVVDGETYYISPRVNLPQIGSNVKLKYSKCGYYAVHLDPYEVTTENFDT